MSSPTAESVHRNGGLKVWLPRYGGYTTFDAHALIEKLADAGIEDDVVALIETAYQLGLEDGRKENEE